MPTYCYSSKDGRIVERVYPVGSAPKRIQIQGRVYHRDFALERPNTRPPGNWPMESYALGVNPDQAKEAEAESVKMGVPTQFASNGDAVFTSPSHRKRYAEALGYFDRNAGYSDPQPK